MPSLTALTQFLASIAITSLALLYFYQRKLIYPSSIPPNSRTQFDEPSVPFDNITLSIDDITLNCFFIPKQSAKLTVLFLHANAGNMGHRLPIAHALRETLGANIFMLSYRGYGKSTGEASEQGLKRDAQAALDWIVENVPKTRIIVYGQSIGGAVAIHLTSKNQTRIDSLIIENTFTSLRKLVPSVMPFLAYFTFLVTDEWNSEESISEIESVPILFLSGLKDELVPPLQMKILYDKAGSKYKKKFVEFKDGRHNDTVIAKGYFEAISNFIKDLSA